MGSALATPGWGISSSLSEEVACSSMLDLLETCGCVDMATGNGLTLMAEAWKGAGFFPIGLSLAGFFLSAPCSLTLDSLWSY